LYHLGWENDTIFPEKLVCFSGIIQKYENDQNRPCL